MNTNLPLDFILRFNGEPIANRGEDCWCYVSRDELCMVGVFDGCGGSGGRCHDVYKGHSEAYMASRLCADAVFEYFLTHDFDGDAEGILQKIKARLEKNTPPTKEGEIVIRGSMVRTLPSTAAIGVVQRKSCDYLTVHTIWAGDSRVYVLDCTGLSQLTIDDSTQPDPMEGQYDDGILTNVLCVGRKCTLNLQTHQLPMPCVILAATDGCFGYVSTPMEFEGILLQTLAASNTPAQWEQLLETYVAEVAGDDHTLCLAAFGFDSFEKIKATCSSRQRELERDYLALLQDMPTDDRQSRRQLWSVYRQNYMKYIEGEPV